MLNLSEFPAGAAARAFSKRNVAAIGGLVDGFMLQRVDLELRGGW